MLRGMTCLKQATRTIDCSAQQAALGMTGVLPLRQAQCRKLWQLRRHRCRSRMRADRRRTPPPDVPDMAPDQNMESFSIAIKCHCD